MLQQPTSSQQMSLTSQNETAAVESNSTTAEVGFLFGQQNSTRTQVGLDLINFELFFAS